METVDKYSPATDSSVTVCESTPDICWGFSACAFIDEVFVIGGKRNGATSWPIAVGGLTRWARRGKRWPRWERRGCGPLPLCNAARWWFAAGKPRKTSTIAKPLNRMTSSAIVEANGEHGARKARSRSGGRRRQVVCGGPRRFVRSVWRQRVFPPQKPPKPDSMPGGAVGWKQGGDFSRFLLVVDCCVWRGKRRVVGKTVWRCRKY